MVSAAADHEHSRQNERMIGKAMGVFIRPESKFYWLWLERAPGTGKGIKERTNVLASVENRDLAEQVYRDRMRQRAESAHLRQLAESHRVILKHERRPPRRDAAGWCYVYFVSDGEHIKIGRAVNVLNRLRAMQSGSAKPLTVLATLLTGDSIESELHRRFKAAHVKGEWYRPVPELLAFIERVKGGADVIIELVRKAA
jgi:hypothetical protein